MRKAPLLILVVLLLLITAGAKAADFGLVQGAASVSLHQRPAAGSRQTGSCAAGSWVQIQSSSGSWYRVSTPDGITGYISKRNVALQQPAYGQVGYVSNPNRGSFLNLRKQPSYDASVLGIYYNGVPALILSSGGGWYHVKVNGVSGYFRQEYLRVVPHAACGTQAATVVTPGGSALNLREGPGYGYPASAQLYGGSYVMVLQQGSAWWKVSAEGVVGFMSAAYLRQGILSPAEAARQGSSRSRAAAQTPASYATVNNPRANQVLNLREAPSADSRVLGRFVSGTRLKMLSQGVEWCHVQVEKTGASGYMMTDYLHLVNLPQLPLKRVTHPQGSYVNLRSAASLKAAVMSRMPDGAQAVILIPGGTWSKIRVNGVTGWVMSAFLK